MSQSVQWDAFVMTEMDAPAAPKVKEPEPCRARRKRTGRRPGNSVTKEEILRAARALFAEQGYEGTTIRTIAKKAGVDGALIHHYFGTKENVFSAVIRDAVHFGEALTALTENPPESLGDDFVKAYLRMWEDPGTRPALLAVYRTASASETAAGLLRTTSSDLLIKQLEVAIGGPQAQLRATLAMALLYGIVAGRHLLKLGGLAGAPLDDVITVAAPIFQVLLATDTSGDGSLLTGPWPPAGQADAEPGDQIRPLTLDRRPPARLTGPASIGRTYTGTGRGT